MFPWHAATHSQQDHLRARWQKAYADAGIGKARLHDLRHAVANHAVMSGETPSRVDQLLGHRRYDTTAGYAHLANHYLVVAAERIGTLIAQASASLSPRHGPPHLRPQSYGRHCQHR